MKIIIAGSRTIIDKHKINVAISNGIKKLVPFNKINEIVVISGGAKGVDLEGEKWAESFNFPIKKIIPDWEKLGKKAGYIRNAEMVKEADALIAIWDERSKGTKHTIDLAKKKKIPIYIEIIK